MKVVSKSTGTVSEAIQVLTGKKLPPFIRRSERNIGHFEFQTDKEGETWALVRNTHWVLTAPSGARTPVDPRTFARGFESVAEAAKNEDAPPPSGKGAGKAAMSRTNS